MSAPIVLRPDAAALAMCVVGIFQNRLPRDPNEPIQDERLPVKGPEGTFLLPVARLWLQFGAEICEVRDGKEYLVKAPTFDEQFQALATGRYATEVERFFVEYTRHLCLINARFGGKPGHHGWQGALTHWDELTPEEKAVVAPLVRRLLAVNLVTYAMAQASIPILEERARQAGPGLDYLPRTHAEDARTKIKDIDRDTPGLHALLASYYWEGGVIPGPESGIVIDRFLPLPPPARLEQPQPTVQASNENEPRLDLPKGDTPPDYTGRRYALYGQYGCKVCLRPKNVFGREDHIYAAYFLRGKKGTQFAFIDCDDDGNACYIFIISRPGQQASWDKFQWALDAQIAKKILRSQGARTFFRRCIHNEEFAAFIEWLLKEGPEVQDKLDLLNSPERPLHWH